MRVERIMRRIEKMDRRKKKWKEERKIKILGKKVRKCKLGGRNKINESKWWGYVYIVKKE